MAAFHGLVVYEILNNGNILNGVFTSRESASTRWGDIDNEIAVKKSDACNCKDIAGDYTCRYIEFGNPTVNECTLRVTKVGEVYTLDWFNDKPIFTGFGFKIDNRLVVSYTYP